MRRAIALFIAALLAVPASAAPARFEFASTEAVLGWINQYRLRPEPARLPAAVRALSRLGAFKDQESAAVHIGFIAGVLNGNPAEAKELVSRMLPLLPEHQWVVVRAIAYSGLPEWKRLLHAFALHMPGRKAMIDKYLAGQSPTLDQMKFESDDPGLFHKLKGSFSGDGPKEVALEPSPELIDTLWGFYFATGAYAPVSRLIAMLQWAKARNSVEKLTIGSMAKYTLATNAAYDADLLAMLKWAAKHQEKDTASALAEVIEAAEIVETSRLRKQALAAIEELRRKGPGYKRDVSLWGTVGQGALALGCVTAAVTGHVEFGLPCVIGGAASSAALNVIGKQD